MTLPGLLPFVGLQIIVTKHLCKRPKILQMFPVAPEKSKRSRLPFGSLPLISAASELVVAAGAITWEDGRLDISTVIKNNRLERMSFCGSGLGLIEDL